jgi:hypothetical protein
MPQSNSLRRGVREMHLGISCLVQHKSPPLKPRPGNEACLMVDIAKHGPVKPTMSCRRRTAVGNQLTGVATFFPGRLRGDDDL